MSGLPAPPVPDAEAAPALRRRLEALGYDEARLYELMAGTDWLTSPSDRAIVDGRLPPAGAFATAFRLFYLGLDVDAGAAEDALEPVSLDAAAAMGLIACEDSVVRGCVQLAPVHSLVVASDAGDSLRGPREFVTGRTPSTLALLGHTLREPVARALDIGCGSGVQALAAARHAESVIATDVNPRALAFTRFNASLNELGNVECREGSWFEPVAGERFELIVANPPFAVSPDSAFLYRDVELPGDTASRHLVAGAAEHLEEGGAGHLICNWIHPPDDWVAPLRRWSDGLGCDAWALRFWSQNALEYATDWNAHLEDTEPDEFEATVARWLDHYRALGIEAIGYGLVVLRRRSCSINWFRAATTSPYPAGDPTDLLSRLLRTGEASTREVAIHEAGPSDLRAASDVLRACGYRDDLHRLPALRFIHQAADGCVFVAEDGEEVIAVSAALGFGATGWLSALGVDPGWRGRGIASRLMDARLAWLRERGAETVHLLATEGGRAVHRQLGCVDEGECTILGLPPLSDDGPAPAGVRLLRDTDADAVRALDAEATGEDRGLVLDACWPHGGLVIEDAGEPVGFHLDCPWGTGPTVARGADQGLALVEALRRRNEHVTWLLLPSANEPACEALPRGRYTMTLMRMRHGPPVPWRAEMLFSACNWYWG